MKFKPGEIVTLSYARTFPRHQAPLFIILGRVERGLDIGNYQTYCYFSPSMEMGKTPRAHRVADVVSAWLHKTATIPADKLIKVNI